MNTHRKPRGQATWQDEPESQPEFRWLERGTGEPVLLLHGLMGQMRHWEPVLEALADEYRPMALTLPVQLGGGRWASRRAPASTGV